MSTQTAIQTPAEGPEDIAAKPPRAAHAGEGYVLRQRVAKPNEASALYVGGMMYPDGAIVTTGTPPCGLLLVTGPFALVYPDIEAAANHAGVLIAHHRQVFDVVAASTVAGAGAARVPGGETIQ